MPNPIISDQRVKGTQPAYIDTIDMTVKDSTKWMMVCCNNSHAQIQI